MRTTERTQVLRKFFSSEKTTQVDSLIDAVLEDMHDAGPAGSEYPTLMTYLERLYELREQETRKPVSRDTVALIAGNLLGILIIVAYEKNNVMTSKGFTQLIRPQK